MIDSVRQGAGRPAAAVPFVFRVILSVSTRGVFAPAISAWRIFFFLKVLQLAEIERSSRADLRLDDHVDTL